jgi:hypothetical protein
MGRFVRAGLQAGDLLDRDGASGYVGAAAVFLALSLGAWSRQRAIVRRSRRWQS